MGPARGGEGLGRWRFQRRVPAAVHHVGRQHAHAVAASVLHQLGWRVEAHGLGVEQGGQEGLGLVALEPGAGVGQQREAGGVAFGKAVFAEALDLAEQRFGEVQRVAVGQQAADQLDAVFVDAALALPGGHGAAQLVGVAGREAGRHHGDLHDLFLEDRHAHGAREHVAHLFAGIGFVFLALASAQVGMHHAALDRPRPHDGHLHHQVVILARPQPGQHAHLRARLDLEHADGVGVADHVVGRIVARRNVLQPQRRATALAGQLQRAAQRRQHAQRQHVDLQQLERVQVVLVPLHHAAVGHGGVLDRHQARELAARDHEAARVLRQVARKAHQRLRQPGPLPRHARVRVQPAGAQRAQHFLLAVPPLVRARHRVDHAVVHAKRAAGVAQHAARSIRDDHRGQRGAVAAILVVDVLDHFLAALVLEVHVDVGRFVALLADEALEQRVAAYRVDLGDAQAVADGRVGGRAPTLAQDALAARELDDVVDGQEIRLVLQVADQAQLFLDLGGDRLGHALREAARGAGLRLLAQVGGGRVARRHDLVRILVAQLVQREAAAPRHRQRLRQRLGRVQAGQPHARAQVALGVAG